MAKEKISLATSSPSMAEPEMPIRISLEGKHAKKFAHHKIGSKVKMLVHAKKTSHSMYNTSKGMNHHVGFDIHKVEEAAENPAEEASESAAEEAAEGKAGKTPYKGAKL